MSGPNFSFIRVELPVQEEVSQITSKRSEAIIHAALTPDTALRQMLELAHTMADALDRLAADIALQAGMDPDSEQITEAVFTCSDVDAAMTILCPDISKERRQ